VRNCERGRLLPSVRKSNPHFKERMAGAATAVDACTNHRIEVTMFTNHAGSASPRCSRRIGLGRNVHREQTNAAYVDPFWFTLSATGSREFCWPRVLLPRGAAPWRKLARERRAAGANAVHSASASSASRCLPGLHTLNRRTAR